MPSTAPSPAKTRLNASCQSSRLVLALAAFRVNSTPPLIQIRKPSSRTSTSSMSPVSRAPAGSAPRSKSAAHRKYNNRSSCRAKYRVLCFLVLPRSMMKLPAARGLGACAVAAAGAAGAASCTSSSSARGGTLAAAAFLGVSASCCCCCCCCCACCACCCCFWCSAAACCCRGSAPASEPPVFSGSLARASESDDCCRRCRGNGVRLRGLPLSAVRTLPPPPALPLR
mmetsp:Transcript_41953/g.110740  ORF Transcript_41953/g.110740 Transcript_41953/m.110740 type:complete len:227 (+) Transcript_41953:1482-2162(+)